MRDRQTLTGGGPAATRSVPAVPAVPSTLRPGAADAPAAYRPLSTPIPSLLLKRITAGARRVAGHPREAH
ncbi:hypothetical protein ACFWA9_37145 [Kitasatospora sp. NPDC059973]|uniref:hypothetical protein n=1 Tax=Kitasatospora sp. NPDC059973 TaxID=3347020 RepID=UPI0036AFB929